MLLRYDTNSLQLTRGTDSTTVFATQTSVGEKPTTYVTTKTIVISITRFTEKPKTVTTGFHFTSTGYNTKATLFLDFPQKISLTKD
jgi:hypothetical protein